MKGLKVYDKKQQRMLDAFFKEFFTWNVQHVGMWLLTGIMILSFVCFMMVPYQEIVAPSEEHVNIEAWLILMGIAGLNYYLMPYSRYNDGTKGRFIYIYEKIKYLPVSLKELRIFRIRKVFWFCLKLFVVLLIGQLVFAEIGFGEIVLGNFLYPFIFAFLIPFCLSVVVILATK